MSLLQRVYLKPRKSPNHAVERAATRRALVFCVASARSLRTKRGHGGRRSLYSR
jgi:hypothetical protein